MYSMICRFGANARGQGIIVKAAETFEMFKDHYFPGEKVSINCAIIELFYSYYCFILL